MGEMRLRLGLVIFILALVTVGPIATPAYALSPSVGSKEASRVDYSTATLNGTVNPNGLSTKTYFEYGTTTSYGSKTSEVSVGSGSSALETAKGVTGLTPNTTYHYRVVASNADGTSTGGDRTFHVGWTLQTTAAPSTAGSFHDVSCSSAIECTAVGDAEGGKTVAERWNGSEWKAQTMVKPAGALDIRINGISCPSSSACFAVGSYKNSSEKWVTLVEFWNGSEWKQQSSPNPTATASTLEAVSCLSATECTAVGTYWNSGPPEVSSTLALRWNGSEWKIQTTPNPSSNSPQLTSVSCTSSTFCMATGFYYDSGSSAYTPLSERWNGSEWTIKSLSKPSGATMSWLYGVSCTSSTACIAVGDKEINAGTHQHQTMAHRWNRSEWLLQSTPNPSESTNLVVEDVSCVSTSDCTAIGESNESSGGPTNLALRWNGSSWTLQAPPVPASANLLAPQAISCVAGRGCEGVGHYRKSPEVAVYPMALGNWRSATPTTTTTAATSVGETSATVNGTVNPNGSETKAYFEYGPGFTIKTDEVNVGAGTSSIERSEKLVGLSPNTTYFFRMVANNENPETSRGTELSFTTMGPPTVTTESPELSATGEDATLRGFVDPNGQSTTYQFEYGTEPGNYPNAVPVPAASAGSSMEGKLVTYTLTGLNPKTKYYYRISATNAGGKATGSEVSFVGSEVTLSVEGTPLKVGAPLEVFSSDFTFDAGSEEFEHTCEETEFSGEVAKNPGANEAVTTTKVQNSEGANCSYFGGLSVKYSIPTEGMALEYLRSEAGEGVVAMSEFVLVGAVYEGGFKWTECKYNVKMSGTYALEAPLELTLSGETERTAGSILFCLATETVTGTFTVKSLGSTVEVGP